MKKVFSSIILPSKKKKRLLPSRGGKAEEKRDKQFQYDIIRLSKMHIVQWRRIDYNS